MAIINIANDSQLGTQLNTALTEATTFRLAAGVYGDRVWPRDITNFPLRIEPQDRNNPPRIHGWMLGIGTMRGNFRVLTQASGSNDTFQDITFDGLEFFAQRFTSAVPEEGGAAQSLIMPDGQGIGWRVCGTSHPAGDVAGYSENGGSSGLVLNSGCNTIVVENCTFNGYANALRVSGADNVTIRHNHFTENCEDMIKIAANFSNLRIEYNTMDNFRGPTVAIARVLGWANSEPPHADWMQQTGTGTDLYVGFNYLVDDTYRVHCGLIRNASTSGRNNTVTLTNNEWRTSHPSGFLVDDTDNLTVTRNKGTSFTPLDGGGSVLEVSPSSNGGGTVMTNNQCTRLYPESSNVPGSWTFSGNSRNNNPNTYPTGFVQFRQDKVAPGVRYAGPYGNDAEPPDPDPPPPTTPPDLETGDVYFEGWMTDPAFPADPRQAPVFEIDPSSPADDAFEIRWAFDTDTPPLARATVNLGTTGAHGGDLYMGSSSGEVHLVVPGDTKTYYIYYHETDGGPRSERSTVSFTETVPTTGTEPVLLFEIDLGLYDEFWYNHEEIERFECEGVLRWTKAGGEQTDSEGYFFNTIEIVDTLPAANTQPPGVLYGVRINAEASPKTRVWISADGARDPDDNVALMIGVANALKIISEDSDYELAGVLTGDTLDGAQYRMIDPDGTLPGWITPNSLFNNIEKNREGAGNLAFFRKWAVPAFESLQIATYDPIAEEVDAGDPWDFDATTLGEISEASQALVADIIAAMATVNDKVVYSAGGGANVPAEAIGYLLNQGYTKADMIPHFAVIQHGRNNWARQYEPTAKTRTVEFTIAVTQQANDVYANGWIGPNLSPAISNPATIDASIYGTDFDDALQVAIGEMGYGSGLPSYATFTATTSGADCGSHVLAFDREALEAMWNHRMITGDNLDEGSDYLINAASGPDRLRVLYNSFTPSDVTTLFNGTGSGTLIAYLNSLLS